MKIAVLDTVYQGYVDHLYRDGSLAEKSWEEQYRATVEGGFPTLSSWVEPLRAKGHQVMDIWADHMPLQLRWCRDHGVPAPEDISANALGYVSIVADQIRHFKPDVIVSGNLYTFDSDFLKSVSDHYRIAVGQHAARLPESDFSRYDAIISSLPNQVEFFNQHGVPSYLVKLAFDSRLLSKVDPSRKIYGLVFAGSVSADHKLRAEALMALGREMPIDLFGSLPDPETLLGNPQGRSALARWSRRVRQAFARPATTKITSHPALWGLEMYRMMGESRIVFNRHIDAADTYANNLRLYEVTGSGSLLLTDWKTNMSEILSPGIECVTYRDTEECVRMAKFYLQNDDKREQIARAGRRRVIAEHTYEHRVDELLAVIEKHLN
jgi:spore maturation protein CgeB